MDVVDLFVWLDDDMPLEGDVDFTKLLEEMVENMLDVTLTGGAVCPVGRSTAR